MFFFRVCLCHLLNNTSFSALMLFKQTKLMSVKFYIKNTNDVKDIHPRSLLGIKSNTAPGYLD